MQDTHDARSIIDAAERAAAAGDYTTAERLLRDAALEQEAELGPLHPELANTLNNLGVVCERLDKLDDAEGSYRRAHEIAAAALPADHPFVATSRKNLDDFRKAHVHDAKAKVHDADRLNRPPTAEAGRVAPQDEPAAAVPHDEPVAPVPQLPPMAIDTRGSESNRSRRSLPVAALSASVVVVLVVVAVLFAMRPRVRSNAQQVASAPADSPASLPEKPPPAAAPIPTSDVAREPTSAATPIAPKIDETRAAPASAKPVLTSAQLCSALTTDGASGDWGCTPPNGPIGPGPLSFYTRLTSGEDTTVQHRWYQVDRLIQSVVLPIRANQSSGYRTYSRFTMNTDSVGSWRIELRAVDGSLLHDERFEVR